MDSTSYGFPPPRGDPCDDDPEHHSWAVRKTREAKEKGEGEEVTEAEAFEVPGPVASARLDPSGAQRLLLGGEGNDLKVFVGSLTRPPGNSKN